MAEKEIKKRYLLSITVDRTSILYYEFKHKIGLINFLRSYYLENEPTYLVVKTYVRTWGYNDLTKKIGWIDIETNLGITDINTKYELNIQYPNIDSDIYIFDNIMSLKSFLGSIHETTENPNYNIYQYVLSYNYSLHSLTWTKYDFNFDN